jgi:hypothetical protein
MTRGPDGFVYKSAKKVAKEGEFVVPGISRRLADGRRSRYAKKPRNLRIQAG